MTVTLSQHGFGRVIAGLSFVGQLTLSPQTAAVRYPTTGVLYCIRLNGCVLRVSRNASVSVIVLNSHARGFPFLRSLTYALTCRMLAQGH